MHRFRLFVFAFACVATLAALQAGGAPAARPFTTAVVDTWDAESDDLARAKLAGASKVRIMMKWSAINPSPGVYYWAGMDAQLRAADDAGLGNPLVYVVYAPRWAIDTTLGKGSTTPKLDALAAFAKIAATRYNGKSPDEAGVELPRVKHWQAWNEPNIAMFLSPQWFKGKFVSPGNYRRMVNAFSNAVNTVDETNVVLAGGNASFSQTGNGVLPFMRRTLCLNDKLQRLANCGPVRFDIWGHHPYTQGGPIHHAYDSRNVSLGDLPEMRRVLVAAKKAKTIAPGVRWWVDEFSWDTKGPDPYLIGAWTHARWVAEALYRMWRVGISLVTWFQIEDERIKTSRYQSGLHYYDVDSWKPKPAFFAFRFPFVSLAKNGRITIWGRVPPPFTSQEPVVIQFRTSSGWVKRTTVKTSVHGVFSTSWRSSLKRGSFRAKVTRGATTTLSLPFSVAPTKDVFLKLGPFGCGGHISCK